MKKILIITLILAINIAAFSQKADPVISALAEKMSAKMKDTLQLSAQEYKAVYEINEMLAKKGIQIWKQYNQVDSIQYFLQRIENTRDSLYKTALPEDKFIGYKQKKNKLINNNNN